jgi:hypothetical protein
MSGEAARTIPIRTIALGVLAAAAVLTAGFVLAQAVPPPAGENPPAQENRPGQHAASVQTATPLAVTTRTPHPTATLEPTTRRPTRTPYPTPAVTGASTPTPRPGAPTLTPSPSPTPYAPGEPLALITSIPPVSLTPEVALEVELHYSEKWARVEQTVIIPNRTADAWTELVFNVPLNAAPGVFLLDGATAASHAFAETPVTPALEGITLRVPLPQPVEPRHAARIALDYRIQFPTVGDKITIPGGLTAWTGSVLRAGEWYPVLAPYEEGGGWRSYPYHPVGDPVIYPAANTTLVIVTEPGVIIAGSGPVSHDETTWSFRVESARGMAFFASTQFWKVEGEAAGVPITGYYLPPYVGAGQAVVDVAEQAITLYSELFGPYPYPSLTIVENGAAGDMEYTALISLSDRVYRNWRGLPVSLVHVLVAHETAHQWWYGAVGNDQVYEPWLDESLATYSEILFYEHYYPELDNWRVDWYLEKAQPGAPVDLPIYAYHDTESYIAALYPRGAMFLHDLRELIGDRAFSNFLVDYQRQYAGRLADAADFFTILRRHTTADLDPLIQEYFAGSP